jgi:hypothetical protein
VGPSGSIRRIERFAGVGEDLAGAGEDIQRFAREAGGRGSTFFHGTDVETGTRFLGGAGLDEASAAARKIDGPEGFFLATHPEDAAYFAARRGQGTVLQYQFTPDAVQQLGGLPVTPLGPLGKFGRFAGGETAVPTKAFDLFNSLQQSGQITVTPFRF